MQKIRLQSNYVCNYANRAMIELRVGAIAQLRGVLDGVRLVHRRRISCNTTKENVLPKARVTSESASDQRKVRVTRHSASGKRKRDYHTKVRVANESANKDRKRE